MKDEKQYEKREEELFEHILRIDENFINKLPGIQKANLLLNKAEKGYTKFYLKDFGSPDGLKCKYITITQIDNQINLESNSEKQDRLKEIRKELINGNEKEFMIVMIIDNDGTDYVYKQPFGKPII